MARLLLENFIVVNGVDLYMLSPGKGQQNPHRLKVLVVDCHNDVLITFERLLERAGYDTTTVWTGHEALQTTRERPFDLVLLNEYLPDMNAEELLHKLRRFDLVPCIVMQPSAARITDTARFTSAGAVAVVSKYSHEEVLAVVAAQIQSSSHHCLQKA